MGKDALRRKLRDEGRPLSADEQKAIEDRLFAWLSARLPGTIAGYLAMPSEVALEGVMERLPGWRWVLPRVEADNSLTFRDRDVPREVHAFGMSQPMATGEAIPVNEIDVFLVPGLAFDRVGGRLGRGGGHFDRVLSRRRKDSIVVGVAPPASLVDRLPLEPHDIPMGLLATVDGVVSCPATT